jgi:hypothetical protein
MATIAPNVKHNMRLENVIIVSINLWWFITVKTTVRIATNMAAFIFMIMLNFGMDGRL